MLIRESQNIVGGKFAMSTSAPRESQRWIQWLAKFEKLPSTTQSALADSLLARNLELYISPTEKCNFRCTYCYEDFSVGKMGAETVARVKKFITQAVGKRAGLHLNWFGGEPLLTPHIVLDVSSFASALCGEHGSVLIGSITTNGYLLTRQLAEELINVGQRTFQITLDGDADAHNAVRRRADGRGTFEVIWCNLRDIHQLEVDYRILLRLHVRPNCEESHRRLLDKIQDEFSDDARFGVGFHALSNLGGPTAGTFEVFSQSEYEEVTARLMEYVAGGVQAGRLEEGFCGATVCYASKPNAYFIRPDGRVGKCTVALDKDYNTIGYLGEDGQLVLSKEKHAKWLDGVYTLDPDTLACPAHLGDAHFRGQ